MSLIDVAQLRGPVEGGDFWAPVIGELTEWFSRWLDQIEGDSDPWPSFDRWTRDSLHQFLGARRVRCFQVTRGEGQLLPLTNELEDVLPARLRRCGLIDHVISSGRRYIRGAPGNGELVERLAVEWQSEHDQAEGLLLAPPDWLIPVRDTGRPVTPRSETRGGVIGLYLVGELPDDKRRDLALLHAAGHLLELFWRHVELGRALSVARRTDQASGVLNRADLAIEAGKILQEAALEGEPTVLLALAVEGVRRLDDQGQWQLRDWLMRQVGQAMRRKLRTDDLVGRFSDDRFVAVLRRLDMALGQLVAAKLLETVASEVSKQPVVSEMVQIRCGLTPGTGEDFESTLRRASQALDQARRQGQSLMTICGGENQAVAASGPPTGADGEGDVEATR